MHTCVCTRVCLYTWGPQCAWESQLSFACTDFTDKAARYFHLRQDSWLSIIHKFSSDTSVEEAVGLSPKKRKILNLVLILATVKSRQKMFGSYKPRLLPHLELKSVSHWPLTSPLTGMTQRFQSVSAWGFILNGITDPESHFPLTLPGLQGTPTVSISCLETSPDSKRALLSL